MIGQTLGRYRHYRIVETIGQGVLRSAWPGHACRRRRPMTVEDNKAIQRRYFEELNKGNVEFAAEYLPLGAVYHGPMGDWTREQFLEFHRGMSKAFPDVHITLDEQVAEGDKVVARWTVRATHTGELQGIPPTGKQVTITGIIISRFENGRDVEAWEELNMLGLMQQIGAIPSRQSGGS